MIKDIFSNLMFNILENCMNFIMVYHLKIEKFERLLHDKTEYFSHLRNLKQALNHGLALKNVHRVIKFNQNAWLKPYIDMNTDLRK